MLLFNFTGAELFQFRDNSESFDLELWQLHLLVVADRVVFVHPTISDVLH